MRFPPLGVAALRNLAWVDSVVIGTDAIHPASDVLPWGVDSIDAEVVHSQLNNKGGGVLIAFIDTGVDCNHSDLLARIVGGYDFFDNVANYCNGGAHGTGAAGILAASVNGSDVIGIAPEASLWALRACDNDNCPDQSIANALYSAIMVGAKVVNLSIATCQASLPGPVANMLTMAYNSHIVLVAAAGNGQYPSQCQYGVSAIARHPGVIGVSSILRNGTQKNWHDYGPEVDFAAPEEVESDRPGGGTLNFDGTSAATPHVAGTAALLLAAGFTNPDLILQRMVETTTHRPASGHDNYVGYGVVNAGAAVVARPRVSGISGPPNPITVAGSYGLSATVVNGLAPFHARWDVYYSSGAHPDVHTSYGSTGYSLTVPSGNYTITVTATPREQTYLREGFASTVTFIVCTEGTNLSASWRGGRTSSAGGGPGIDAAVGCSPPPPDPED
jgi:subtilisin